MNKTTDELMNELKFKNCNINDYLKRNKNNIVEVNLSAFWNGLIKKSRMTKVDIINKSDFSYVYFYDVINGRKIPSSDKIVRLIVVMHLSLDDCQAALKFCGKSPLYAKFKRDSIIIAGINQGKTIAGISLDLGRHGQEVLK